MTAEVLADDEERLDAVLRALAHGSRRSMLRLVQEQERTAGDLARLTHLSGPAASQHLKVLRDAGLVQVRSDGTRRLYRLDPVWLARVRAELDSFWSESLDRLKAQIEGST